MRDRSKILMCVIVDKRDGDVYWTDEVGGFHSPPIGWGPDGVNCGECCEISCKGCKVYNGRFSKEKLY